MLRTGHYGKGRPAIQICTSHELEALLKLLVVDAEGDGVRCELAGIRYEYNVLGTRGPRKMTALIPGTDAHGQNYIFRPESSNDGILDRSASLSCAVVEPF